MPQVFPLDPMPSHIVIHHGHGVAIADREAFIGDGTQGFYWKLTRFLSRLRLSVCGAAPRLVAAGEIDSRRAFAYYLAPTPAGRPAGPDPDSDKDDDEIVQTGIEIHIDRVLGGALCDDIVVTNRALAAAEIALHWEIDADFADYSEAASGKRQQDAPVERHWQGRDAGGELTLRYGHPQLRHSCVINFGGDGEFSCEKGEVGCTLRLEPQQAARLSMEVAPVFCGARVTPLYDATHELLPTAATRQPALALKTQNGLVQAAWDRAVDDLAGLALLDGDGEERLMPAAGIPKYVAMFGRDVLVSAFQAASLDPPMLRGSLHRVAQWNARSYDDRFDAEPGRVIHQRQESPLALLEKNPFLHYYGDYSAPGWFLIDVAWDLLLTGDREFFRSMREKVLATLEWMDRDADRDHDGFYEYATKAGDWGEKNQGWKDSRDAILYKDGRLVHDPIALVEIQGCFYAAKQLIVLAFEAIGESERAARLRAEAEQLKRRFNRAFWMPRENYFALALDPEKRPVDSIAPDAGQCLSYGIVADELAPALAERLMQPDLFTGWGLRTLSSRHPAFNPFSYHRGSVWPVSNAIIGHGLKRYGFTAELHLVAKALLEASALFDLRRLPEVFGGHQRDAAHPHPGLYPKANSPQAWSASAVIHLVQALLGLIPAAPWGALIVDPDLPDWLPELTLAGIRVGDASATIRFRRDGSGATHHEILECRGRLRVHRALPRPRGADGFFAQLDSVRRAPART